MNLVGAKPVAKTKVATRQGYEKASRSMTRDPVPGPVYAIDFVEGILVYFLRVAKYVATALLSESRCLACRNLLYLPSK
jgi:hypothetical protein